MKCPKCIYENKKSFEQDLKNVLTTLELLCQNKADHIDYVKAYKYFLDTWAPNE